MKIKDIIKRIQLYPDDMDVDDGAFNELQNLLESSKYGYDAMHKIPSSERKWYTAIFDKIGVYCGIKCKCCGCMIRTSNQIKNHHADCPVKGEHE